MLSTPTLALDVVILGGGAAGLWSLDHVRERGYGAVLLEAGDLGSGQTIASQGIIHGGLKYTLSGLFNSSAEAIRNMPLIWRSCLAGERRPDLRGTALRAHHCHLWRTDSLRSRLAMIGARAGLRVKPAAIDPSDRPAALAECPGTVARLDEQVIEPATFIRCLAQRQRSAILKIDATSGLEFVRDESGEVAAVRLINPENGEAFDLHPRHVVLAAGEGNGALREKLQLDLAVMQRRPLHMVMARGDLPVINGHCVEGASTRVTITTTIGGPDERVWQVGGQVAETGLTLSPREQAARAHRELRAILPGVDFSGVQWATYRANRAEAARGGQRPDDVSLIVEGNVLTAWPTKLALVPRMAERIAGSLTSPAHGDANLEVLRSWPRPSVALSPWETCTQWFTDV
jgi:glycine/D-amino acid oxidase-like deaminating enzyme